MKSHTRYLTMHTAERMEFVNITGEVEKAVSEACVQEGLCLVNAADHGPRGGAGPGTPYRSPHTV